jgi:SAM-dependent methyltransferase
MSINLRSDNYKHLYNDSYFQNRNFIDKKRLKSFDQEKEFIYKYVKEGLVCDIGCSTGEFLSHIEWNGDKYGMEINENAKKMAKNIGISFEKDILNQVNFFDIVIFRGTIQHLPNPFSYIQNAYKALKPGGYIVFLATPNMNSIYYKCFNDLPMLSKKLNFFIPSDIVLSNVLANIGFFSIQIERPYLSSPYASYFFDHIKFFKKLIFRTSDKFAFWGSSINIIARKTL